MSDIHQFGAAGEDQAAAYLESRGLKIVERNFRCKLGEVDLVARDQDVWVFVEVKARQSHHAISALDAITPTKQRRIVRAALLFMKSRRLHDVSMRFDVITLEGGDLKWIPSAFEPTDSYSF